MIPLTAFKKLQIYLKKIQNALDTCVSTPSFKTWEAPLSLSQRQAATGADQSETSVEQPKFFRRLDWVTMAECKQLEADLSKYTHDLADCNSWSKQPALVPTTAPLGCEASQIQS
jgi:hypothetical protein